MKIHPARYRDTLRQLFVEMHETELRKLVGAYAGEKAMKQRDTSPRNLQIANVECGNTTITLNFDYVHESPCISESLIAIENTGIVAIFIVGLASRGKATLSTGRHNRATDRTDRHYTFIAKHLNSTRDVGQV